MPLEGASGSSAFLDALRELGVNNSAQLQAVEGFNSRHYRLLRVNKSLLLQENSLLPQIGIQPPVLAEPGPSQTSIR